MYYNRTLTKDFEQLLTADDKLRWLFDFVKNHEDLDFLVGRNKSKEWISVYRGLSRVLTITKTNKSDYIKLDGANAYKNILPKLYGLKHTSEKFDNELEHLLIEIANTAQFDRYYKNKKEGYFQNKLSKVYGICGKPDTDFVIIDKEAVIGYSNQAEKDKSLGGIRPKYKQLQKEISLLDPGRYGKNLEKKAIGNELDFLALDKEGNILLIEYKHGTSTSGIYLSPLQIGLYNDIFASFPKKELGNAVFEMLEQKMKIGLINPQWKKPKYIRDIIPVLIISEYNYRSSAKAKFEEVVKIAREQLGSNFLKKLLTFNFTIKNGLSNW